MTDDGLRSYCDINLSAIEFNFKQIRTLAGPNRWIAAVVKANAYGHGLPEIVNTLSVFDKTIFAVATPDEVVRFRKSGFTQPLLLLTCLLPHEVDLLGDYDFIPNVAHQETAIKIDCLGKKLNKKIIIQIETDTGIGRIGPFYDSAVKFVSSIKQYNNIDIHYMFTHLAASDEDDVFTKTQLNRFNMVQEELKRNNISIPIYHAANSAGVIQYPDSYYQMVRPGLMIYGLYPDESMSGKIDLHQAMSLYTSISHIREALPGHTVSYGHTFVAWRKTKIATVNVGYRNGFNRLLSNNGYALVRGGKVPIIGRICMDQLMVDVTDVPDVQLGDQVVFAGKQGDQFISLSEISRRSSTINYETACTLGSMNQRFYSRDKN